MSIKKKIARNVASRDEDTYDWGRALQAGFRQAMPRMPGHCLMIQQLPNKQLISLSTPMSEREQLKFLYFHIERIAQGLKRKPSEVAFEALMEYGNEESERTETPSAGDVKTKGTP